MEKFSDKTPTDKLLRRFNWEEFWDEILPDGDEISITNPPTIAIVRDDDAALGPDDLVVTNGPIVGSDGQSVTIEVGNGVVDVTYYVDCTIHTNGSDETATRSATIKIKDRI